MKYKIDLTCDEWYVADSLHELGARIENDDLLDEMQDGRVTVSGDHYTAEITEVSECDDDPLADYSEDYRKGIAYVKEQMEDFEKDIIRAKVNRNYAQHDSPSTGLDDHRIIDLLEEYGEDHDLPEGWYLDEYDADDVMLMI